MFRWYTVPLTPSLLPRHLIYLSVDIEIPILFYIYMLCGLCLHEM